MTVAGAIDRLRTLDPRVVDGLLALALATTLEVQLVLRDEPGASAAAVIGGLALTGTLAWRRRAPLAVVLAFVTIAAVQEALGGGVFAGEPPLIASLIAGGVAFYSLGAYAGERAATLGLAAGVLGLWTTVLVSAHRDLQSFVFSAGLVALSPWLAGRTARARALRSALLGRERDQRARMAAGEERQRIARELHDTVAHGVVVMVVQAQGARRILEQDPDRAREALRAIEETGHTALAELRRSLGLLREDHSRAELKPQPRLHDLGSLVAEMRQAGLSVQLHVQGVERELAEGLDRSAYRIVQEALTNTMQHAGLVPTRVTVSYGAEDLRLEIADEGPAVRDGARPGHGLAGMRERARLYGGELEAHPADGRGFVVRARIPLPA
ncbi:MAG TPA: histidine kinase [Baekduia sp.]|uniref:sensor histidine kinase n=1 Tax=Baekduia sp. TaxID=2600305 RepID=UPI002BA7DAC8|nr:histidine kinase [Baekduia sp.]HMJ36212.1 histidine kinase [Baekduia sp.]